MDRRNAMLTVIGTLAVANRPATASEDSKPDSRLYRDVASLTITQFNDGLQKEGYQHRFLAHQICFQCTCKPFQGELDKKPLMYVEIDGLKPKFLQARLFNLSEDLESKLVTGSRLDVHGLILQENYSVWWIWVYTVAPLPAVESR